MSVRNRLDRGQWSVGSSLPEMRGDSVIALDGDRFESIASVVGDTPFSATPFFLLRRRTCDVYADSVDAPRYGTIIPHAPLPTVHVFGAASLEPAESESLAEFVARLDSVGGYLVPRNLVQPIRARRQIDYDVEGLCFTFRRAPGDFAPWRPELVRRLVAADAPQVEALPDAASFMFQHYGSGRDLLDEGLAFGVFQGERLVSMSASLVLTPKHCDVGVFTLRRFRHLGYATDCVEAILSHLFARGIQPLWRIGLRQKVALYFAEKLEMDEIGTNGQEIYLHVSPS